MAQAFDIDTCTKVGSRQATSESELHFPTALSGGARGVDKFGGRALPTVFVR
jgi:hypothetical protein